MKRFVPDVKPLSGLALSNKPLLYRNGMRSSNCYRNSYVLTPAGSSRFIRGKWSKSAMRSARRWTKCMIVLAMYLAMYSEPRRLASLFLSHELIAKCPFMTQNIYDNPTFFEGYNQLDRSVYGLSGAAEWPTIQAMLPDLRGRRIVDLGCGFGWFCRWAREQGARSVLGLDVSALLADVSTG